ncbi:mandelate racemase/muconate lactonizing enzyme family protein [Phytohabitans sp. ZYX-F-186]|uniref:Mandelate racemase/muconate lactonizing enzyme family protein n=1 Tax=Phytohabitans maris TaxID=3071409 RepID=A0ABU0ZBE7_9ACTN|nr:mandelate racemase/muconate lactonizing enzyme family protein [Phytohabitans sp. ZYX-F-186]MDQ7903632.1 mandelate racemase/muconate lactonizing enzyme family protein [Phytohabitans sp. ZYX-F-186]
MKVVAVESFRVRVPVRPLAEGGVAPYRGSQDPVGVSAAESLLVAVRTDTGLTGWGEMNTGFPPRLDTVLVDELLAPLVVGRDPAPIRALVGAVDSPYWPHLGRPALASALEMALWDLHGQRLGQPVSALLGGRIRDRVPVAYCLGITAPEQAVEVARRVLGDGFRVLKLKIGADLDADLARVRAVVEATGGRLALRLDANQGFDRTTAARLVDGLAGLPVEYVEQPLPVGDLDGMRALRHRGTVPIAANEDAYPAGGLARCLTTGAVDAAVVDLEPAGGLLGLVRSAALAEELHTPLAHHCGWDLGVKAAAMLQLTSTLPAFRLAADSTYTAHADDVLVQPLTTVDGAFVVPDGPGLGVTVDEEKVHRLRADEATVHFGRVDEARPTPTHNPEETPR